MLLSLLLHAVAAPNLVVLLTDDLDVESMAHLPGIAELMPGATFDNAFVSLSLCCPSRSTLLRGQYAHNHHVYTNNRPNGGFAAFRPCETSTIATWLQDAGYRTGLFGKYLNHFPLKGQESHVPPGWTEFVSPVTPKAYMEYDYSLSVNGTMEVHGHEPEDYLVDVLSKKVNAFVTADPKKPFFAYVTPFAPHAPSTPAPRYEQAFGDLRLPRPASFDEADIADKPSFYSLLPSLNSKAIQRLERGYRRRLASMLAVQDLLKSLEDTLRDRGQLENTYIIFASDNGFHLGQHRLTGGKNTAYEEDLRVPLMVRGPGIPAGLHIPAMVVNTDYAPTLAELAGAKVPDFVDGRSFVPWLRGETPPSWREMFLMEHYNNSEEEDGNAAMYNPPGFFGVRSMDWKYVEYDDGSRELYDLRNDPGEMQNRVGQEAERVAEIKARLERLKSCAGEGCRKAEEAGR